ncbi:MAG TPA: sulfatase, partial [Thermoanaerobaculia bacterium]
MPAHRRSSWRVGPERCATFPRMPALRRFASAAVLSLLACSPARRAPARVYDLVALFPLAEARREVGTIDFGSPEGKEHLGPGWYSNQRDKDGTSFVWSRGEVSVVEFYLAAPRELRAELRCAPLPGGPPQAVSAELNGRRLGSLELAPGMRGYAVDLPRSALRAGTNHLAFRYRSVSEPSRQNGHRRLAVQWDALRFLPAATPEEPRAEKGALVLPFGSEAAYYLDLAGGGELALERIEPIGDAGGSSGGGRLVVTAEVEGGRTAARALEAGSSAHALRLPGSGPRLLRLTLRAVDAAAAASMPGGGLRLAAPTVRAASSALPAPRAAARPRTASPPPNVVVYLVDTLRADRLGCYGSARPTSPAVDAFARGATLFERAIAQSSWTRPSVTSVLTGFGPLAHGVTTLDDRLPDAATTLPEMLRAAGYRTAAFSTNPQVSAGTGLAQGFDDFELIGGNARSDAVNRRVLGWVDAHRAHRGRSPFFLYVHTIDPHAPYEPTAEMLRRFAAGVPARLGSREGLNEIYRARGEER